MKISILINSRNRFEVLARCLRRALTQDYPDFEVLVLDDFSTTPLAGLIAAEFTDSRLRCFRSEQALGVAGGRNFLMQQAAGDIFCLIDDDAVFADDHALARFAAAFDQFPQAGILTAKIINHYPHKTTLNVPFSKGWLKKRPELVDTPGKVSYFLGTCHAICRRVMNRCQSYRGDMMFGEEELDLSYQAIEQGFEIMYLPQVVAHHFPQPSVVGRPAGRKQRSESFYHVRNRFFLAYKYLPLGYIPVYLTLRLGICAAEAIRAGTFMDFLAGLVSGVRQLKTLSRTPLGPAAVRYQKNHYGRLWY
jgi:GT2 family glycosyltransferase